MGAQTSSTANPLPKYIDPTVKKGDVNGDGVVDGADIQEVINTILSGEYVASADVNKDQAVDGADIQEVTQLFVRVGGLSPSPYVFYFVRERFFLLPQKVNIYAKLWFASISLLALIMSKGVSFAEITFTLFSGRYS